MISKLLFGLLILFTLATTAMSVLKVSSEIKENTSVLPTITTVKISPEIEPTTVPTVKLFPTVKLLPTENIIPSKNQCLIVVSGQQYNVTSLRSSHSGGDIFQCGTDMTGIYQGKHGSKLSLIQKYLITSTGLNSVLPTAIPQNNGGDMEEDDDD